MVSGGCKWSVWLINLGRALYNVSLRSQYCSVCWRYLISSGTSACLSRHWSFCRAAKRDGSHLHRISTGVAEMLVSTERPTFATALKGNCLELKPGEIRAQWLACLGKPAHRQLVWPALSSPSGNECIFPREFFSESQEPPQWLVLYTYQQLSTCVRVPPGIGQGAESENVLRRLASNTAMKCC